MSELTSYIRSHKIGKFPAFDFTPSNVVGLLSVSAASTYLAHSVSGNISGSLLTGLALSAGLWATDRYWKFSEEGSNDGYHPLTDPPDSVQKVVSHEKQDAELTAIYRKVFKSDSIRVELDDSHTRYFTHIIFHDDIELTNKRKLRALALELKFPTDSEDPPFRNIASLGNGAAGLVIPKVIPDGELPKIIPFDSSFIKAGVLVSFIGVDIMGRVMSIFRIKTPHVMFIGGTNSGKTVGLRNQIWSDYLARKDSIIYGIDYKAGIKSAPFTKFTSDMNEAYNLLLEFKQLAEESSKIVRESDYDNGFDLEANTSVVLPPKHLVIDEYNVFRAKVDKIILNEWAEEKAAAKEAGDPAPIKPDLVNDIIGELARVHRAGNVFITIAGQKFLADEYPSDMTDMFDARACFRVVNSAASRQAVGENGAEELPEMGGLMLRAGSGNIQIGAAAFMTAEDRLKLLSD